MKIFTGEDLTRRLEELDMPKQDFADMMGVQASAISNWLARGVPPKKIKQVCELLNIQSSLDKEFISEDTQEDTNIKIPKLRNITVSAGAGFDVNNIDETIYDGTLIIDTKDVIKNGNVADSLIAVRVDGRSMSPTLNHNEWVVVNKDKTAYIGDNLYVVNYAGNLLVKRLQYDPSLNSIEIISDNPSYKNYKINLSEDQQYFQIIGLVITILVGC